MNKTVTYRPKGNLIWGSVALLLDAFYLIQALFYPVKGENLLADLAVVAAIAVLIIGIWVRPKLVLHAEHLEVTNPIKTTRIEYTNILELDTKWTLQIHHVGGRTRVWVAPASGKYRWIAESNRRNLFGKVPISEGAVVEVTSMSQSLNSDSGLAAHLIRERIEGLH